MRPTMIGMALFLAWTCTTSLLWADSSKSDFECAAMNASKLKTVEIAGIEKAVKTHPGDLMGRAKLLGYYNHVRFQNLMCITCTANVSHSKQVFWIIEHEPGNPLASISDMEIFSLLEKADYLKAKNLWQAQIEKNPRDVGILANAANFFLVQDGELAENYLLRAANIDPKDPQWNDRLGHYYDLKAFGKDTVLAKKALVQFEEADRKGMREYSDLAQSAYDAGELTKAKRYAGELLSAGMKGPCGPGDAIHHGNLVLGRIALREGKVEEAESFLLKSASTDKPSAPMSSFGPNMALAKELLEKGRPKAVLAYFELCRKFWKFQPNKLDEWTKTVQAGKVPDFGTNLVY